MPELMQEILNHSPEAAILVDRGRVVAANELARHYLPQLKENAPLPDYLNLPQPIPAGAGLFTEGCSTYSFHQTSTAQGELIYFRPAPQAAMTDLQLDGTLRSLRTLMGELLLEIGGQTAAPISPKLNKSYHRMFRLINNMEMMRSSASPERTPFHPTTLDIAGLCRQLAEQTNSLLRDINTTVEYQSALNSLLIPGDPQLLQRMLLGLISNCVRRAQGGSIVLCLRRQGNRALISISDSAGVPTPRQLSAMLQQDTDNALPDPAAGAGLGLPVVRHIVELHKGLFFVEYGQKAPCVIISLPTTPLSDRLGVRTPTMQTGGGLSPLLVELSDVLPVQLFAFEGLE